MKNVRELETCGAILIGCGIMAYTLMLASVDAPVWATIEFVMGTLFMVVGVWCVYLAGMEYDYQMEKRRHRNKTIAAIGRSSVGKGARASGRMPFFFGFLGAALRAA